MHKIFIFILILLVSTVYAQPSWFKSQIGTGKGNCGPACAAMAIHWATNKQISVEEIRNKITYSREDGSTSLNELFVTMKMYKINVKAVIVYSLKDLVDIVFSRDTLVLVNLDTSFLSMGSYDSIYGRTYTYNGGHYIILNDVVGDYFLVQDPLEKPDRLYKMNEVWQPKNGMQTVIVIKK